ncbi:hypothetical protein ACFL24_01745 [Patescibacteria group bacterium]
MCSGDFHDWDLGKLFEYIAQEDVYKGSASGGIVHPLNAIRKQLRETSIVNAWSAKKWREFIRVIADGIKEGKFSNEDEVILEIRLLLHERVLDHI